MLGWRALLVCVASQLSLALDSGTHYLPVVVSSVTVPQYGVQGKQALLHCSYRSVQPVYSVRWYKNGKEFYSYRPGRTQPISVHPVAGVQVEVESSGVYQVTLRDLSLSSTGRYRCEVSEEAPTFATDSKYGDLLVVVAPRQGPQIHGVRQRYHVGERLQANCTSGSTLPPANLTWYINQKLVDQAHVHKLPVVNISRVGDEGEEHWVHGVTLAMEHTVHRRDFSHQKEKLMRLKCVATIYDAYYKVVEISVKKLRRKKAWRGGEIEEEEKEEFVHITRHEPAKDRPGPQEAWGGDTSSSSLALALPLVLALMVMQGLALLHP